VIALADEGLEGAEPVGVTRLTGVHGDVEVAPQVSEVPFERGDIKRAGRRRGIWSMVRNPPSSRSTA